jgi:hypothetical protein
MLELQIPARVTQLRWPQRRVPPRRAQCAIGVRTHDAQDSDGPVAGSMSRHSTRLRIFTSLPHACRRRAQ